MIAPAHPELGTQDAFVDRGSSRRWLSLATAALIVAASLTVPGCSSTDPRIAFELPSGADSPTSDINPHERAALKDGGTLRLPMWTFPKDFNPEYRDTSLDWRIAEATYPRSFITESDGSLTLNTEYFNDIQQTSTDPPVVTYTINPQATWSDGSPITWEDIASEVHALSGDDPRFEVRSSTGFDRVASVTRGASDRQAIVTFKQPYPEWRGLFAGTHVLLPHSMTANPDTFNKGQRDGRGPSAGPFVVSHIDKPAKEITLARNPRWWGPPPRLEFITLRDCEDKNYEDVLQALADGQIDAVPITSGYYRATILAFPGSFGDIEIRRAPELQWWVIDYNGAPGNVLESKELRLAISKGIDRDAIVRILQRELGDNPGDNPLPVNSHIFMPRQKGYPDPANPDIPHVADVVAYNPDHASTELDDLGWKLYRGDVRIKDGKPLILRTVSNDRELARLLQLELAHIGVKVTIIDEPPEKDFLKAGKFDIRATMNGSDAYPLSTMEQRFRTNGVSNYGKIGNQDIDAKIEQAMTTADESTARDLANTVDQMVWQEAHSLPLGQSPGVVAVRKKLANYGAFGMADRDYTAIGFTQ